MSVSNRRFAGAVVAALAALVTSSLSLSCGGGGSPSGSTPPVTTAPLPTPAPPSGGNPGAASCQLGEGSPSAGCEKASSRLVDAVVGAMDLLVQQKPAIFDKTDEAGSRHGAVPGARQGGLPERPRRQPGRARLLRPAGSRRLHLRADPGQERERLLRELRRAHGHRLHAAGRQLPRDLHAGLVPGRPGRPAAGGQRLRRPLPGGDQPHELQGAPVRVGRPHARLDAHRRARPGVLRGHRLHGRPLAVRGPARGQLGARALRDLAGRLRPGHRAPGPDLDRERPVLHRQGQRLREPPHEPVRPARLRERAAIRSARRPGPVARWRYSDEVCVCSGRRRPVSRRSRRLRRRGLRLQSHARADADADSHSDADPRAHDRRSRPASSATPRRRRSTAST